MNINKKGDLTSTQIIIIVLAIIGFGIVLVALFLIGFESSSDKDICKLSVLTRASSPVEAAQSLVPLKCRTSKICLTADASSKCFEQYGRDDDVQVIRLSGNEYVMANKISEISANAMYDCWDMMGQGKLNLFANIATSIGADVVKSTCVICSRVAVDKSVGSDVLSHVDIQGYMKNNQIPGKSMTYLEAFTDRGVSSYANVKDDVFKNPAAKVEGENVQIQANPQQNQIAFVFMQIKSEKWSDVLNNLLGAGVAGTATTFMMPIGGRVVAGVAGGATKAIILSPVGKALAVSGVLAAAGYSYYNSEQSQANAAMYCGPFTGKDKDAQGCSVVQAVNYNANDINTICADIQSYE
ncbi:MAG: hypothetical protein QXS38_00185 [Candidatus Pacearchaeota archaeon]